jgi:ATP-dependent helicase HepA
MNHYIQDNLGLKVWYDDQEGNTAGGRPGRDSSAVVRIRLRGGEPPLIPASRLTDLAGYANRRSTVQRTLASRHPELEFFRPGHPLVDELWSLSQWDERGKAFALWRRVNGLDEPSMIFRVCISSFPDLEVVRDTLDQQRWDSSSRASLLRLVNAWAALHRHDVFLDTDGRECSTLLVRLCTVPYDNRQDINLGGPRAHVLTELVGEADWKPLCQSVAEAGVEHFRRDRATVRRSTEAQGQADEYFETMAARIRNRRDRAQEEEEQAEVQLVSLQSVGALVRRIVAAPRLVIDAIGVYVLSERPVCPR